LLSGLLRSVLGLLGSSSSGGLCLLGSLSRGVLRLLGNFLEAWGEALRRLADLIYRLARGVLHPLRDFPNLAGYFPDLLGCSSSHFADLLGHITQSASQATQALLVLLAF
jgi:hypothetical protein